jgi:hypothetical protein
MNTYIHTYTYIYILAIVNIAFSRVLALDTSLDIQITSSELLKLPHPLRNSKHSPDLSHQLAVVISHLTF